MPVPIAGLLSGAAKIVGSSRKPGSGRQLASSIVKREPKKSEDSSLLTTNSSSALAIRPKQSIVPYEAPESPQTGGMKFDDKLVVIQTKVIEIDALLKGTLAADKNIIDQSNRQKELEEEKEREEKLEKKKKKKKEKKDKGMSIPGMELFGAIGNFITNVVLGFILSRLVDHAPKLEGILKGIASVVEWASSFVIGFVDVLGTFLKWGNDAYKATEGFVEKVFGEEGKDAFNGFTDGLINFLNWVTIVGMAAASVGNELDLFRKKGKGKEKEKKKLKKKLKIDESKPGFFKKFASRVEKFVPKPIKNFATIAANRIGNLGRGLQQRYKQASSAIGQSFKNLKAGAQRQIVNTIIDPIQNTFIKPLAEKIKPIVAPLMAKLESIPGIGNTLKKVGMQSLSDAPKYASKFGAKAIPFIGGIFNLLFAYDRFAGGDSVGGIIETISAILDFTGLAPASMALDAYMFMRDIFPETFVGVEDSIVNGLGLGDLKNKVDGTLKKLPDLGKITKIVVGNTQKTGKAWWDPMGVFTGEQKLPEKMETSQDTGNQSEGSKVAGKLGKFLNQRELRWGSGVTEHPEHGGVTSPHATNSYHYVGRAIDIGGWGPNRYSTEGMSGVDDQTKIIQGIREFNEMEGVKPVEFLHEGNEPRGHNDHVHIAYQRGGFTKGMAHKAILGEVGPEFVIDTDSAMAIEGRFPGLLDAINNAKGKKSIDVLENYASYDDPQNRVIVIEGEPEKPSLPAVAQRSMNRFIFASHNGSDYDPFEFLDYQS